VIRAGSAPIQEQFDTPQTVSSSKVETTGEATSTTTSATTATAHTSTHLATKHLEQDLGINLRSHSTTHTSKSTSMAKLLGGINQVFTTVVASALFRIREGFVGFTDIFESICCCFVSLVLFISSYQLFLYLQQ
jgi:hypothetical protein